MRGISLKWWFMATGIVIVAGILTAFLPVDRGAAVEPAPIDERQLDAIAERVAARVMLARIEAPPPAPKPVWHAAPETPREATREQESAADQAGQIVDEALARRALSAEDVKALRALSPKLQPAAQNELRTRMIRALTRHELKLDPRAVQP